MANYLFLRGNRNKLFFSDIAEELNSKGHKSFQLKFELGELLFKSKIPTFFVPLHVTKKEYPISDEDLLKLNIYNITYKERVLHKKISSRELSLYKRYMNYINQFVEKNNISIICLFNGYHWLDQIAKVIADKKKIKVIYFEDGLFRPYTVTCDPKGINSNSLVPKEDSFYDELSINEERLSKYLYRPENDKLLDFKKENLLLTAIVKLLSMIGSSFRIHPNYYAHITFWQALKYFVTKNLFRFRRSDKIPFKEEYVFLPFQVSRDTQIFYNSPHIRDMESLMKLVYRTIQQYNKENHTNLRLIVKEHPEDMSRNNYKKLKKEFKNNPTVLFVKKYNIHEIIKHAKCIITINSTVGLEALAKHKKVITLGDALYNIKGVVEHCDHPNKLGEAFNAVMRKNLNKKRIDKFLYFLRFHYQVEGTIQSRSKITSLNIAKKLINYSEEKIKTSPISENKARRVQHENSRCYSS